MEPNEMSDNAAPAAETIDWTKAEGDPSSFEVIRDGQALPLVYVYTPRGETPGIRCGYFPCDVDGGPLIDLRFRADGKARSGPDFIRPRAAERVEEQPSPTPTPDREGAGVDVRAHPRSPLWQAIVDELQGCPEFPPGYSIGYIADRIIARIRPRPSPAVPEQEGVKLPSGEVAKIGSITFVPLIGAYRMSLRLDGSPVFQRWKGDYWLPSGTPFMHSDERLATPAEIAEAGIPLSDVTDEALRAQVAAIRTERAAPSPPPPESRRQQYERTGSFASPPDESQLEPAPAGVKEEGGSLKGGDATEAAEDDFAELCKCVLTICVPQLRDLCPTMGTSLNAIEHVAKVSLARATLPATKGGA